MLFLLIYILFAQYNNFTTTKSTQLKSCEYRHRQIFYTPSPLGVQTGSVTKWFPSRIRSRTISHNSSWKKYWRSLMSIDVQCLTLFNQLLVSST